MHINDLSLGVDGLVFSRTAEVHVKYSLPGKDARLVGMFTLCLPQVRPRQMKPEASGLCQVLKKTGKGLSPSWTYTFPLE